LRDELLDAQEKFHAKAAAGLITDVRTGEVVALVSLPDYDPNNPRKAVDPTRINRLTTGVYEMGSTFKALTLAMALDSGKVTLASTFDARVPLRYGKFSIGDYHAQNRVLSVPEIFTYSSNIGTARMALAVGVEAHKNFLKKMGQLDRLRTELPESAEPLVPKRWGELNTVTIAFGHGLSVAPLQAVSAIGALMNGGRLIPPTFLKRSEADAKALAKQVVKPETSEKMRYLMRLNVLKGSGTHANIPGYRVGGKTGTAEVGPKIKDDAWFAGFAPAEAPRLVVCVLVIHGGVGGETAAPIAGNVLANLL
jgi:cell division protein FtsI (penicillin-binding protein 3)